MATAGTGTAGTAGASASRVGDVLARAVSSPSIAARVMQYLRLETGTRTDLTDARDGLLRCPMPGHEDRNPSCNFMHASQAFYCHAGCGTITLADLLIAHGRAASRAEAASTIIDLAGLSHEDAASATRDPSGSIYKSSRARAREDELLASDPTLVDMTPPPPPPADAGASTADVDDYDHTAPIEPYTVADYAAERGFDPAMLRGMGVHDAEAVDPHGRRYRGVLMTSSRGTGSPLRARMRSLRDDPGVGGGGKPVWAHSARIIDADADADRSSAVVHGRVAYAALPKGAYGIDFFAPSAAGSDGDIDLAGVLLVVEGESDVHAAHHLGITSVVGVPGATMLVDEVPESLIDAARRAAVDPATGEVLSSVRVVVVREPGAAGGRFPGLVADAMEAASASATDEPPSSAPSMTFAALDLTTLPGSPKDVCAAWMDLGRDGSAQVIGAVADAAALARPRAMFEEGEQVDAAPRALEAQRARASSAAPEDRWGVVMNYSGAPLADDLHDDVHLVGMTMRRTEHGWAAVKVTDDGTTLVQACRPLWVSMARIVGDERRAVVTTPDHRAQEWVEVEVDPETLAAPQRLASALMNTSAEVAPGQGAARQVQALVHALVEVAIVDGRCVVVPTMMGWESRPGASSFAGLEVRPACDEGAAVFDANERRRTRLGVGLRSETHARAWWDATIAPLIDTPARDGVTHVRWSCPLVALGAAAAGPLLRPLKDEGINGAPVTWLAGRGGGGKTVTQNICSGVFVPADDDYAFSRIRRSADASQAALFAIASEIRDVGISLDDLMRIPTQGVGRPSSADRMKAGAKLAMSIFNSNHPERATRSGQVRKGHPFQMTAVFSGEESIESVFDHVDLSVGERRRIIALDCQPMADRGLGHEFAEGVNEANRDLGGAAGEMLVSEVRRLVSAKRIRALHDYCRSMMPGGDTTRRGAAATCLLGLAALKAACTGCSIEDAVDEHAASFAAVCEAGLHAEDASAGSSSERLADSVRDMVISNPFAAASAGDAAETIGRTFMFRVRDTGRGMKRVFVNKTGMDMLVRQYGVTQAMLDDGESDGVVFPRRSVRWFGAVTKATMFMVDFGPEGGEVDDDDPRPSPDGAPPAPPASSMGQPAHEVRARQSAERKAWNDAAWSAAGTAPSTATAALVDSFGGADDGGGDDWLDALDAVIPPPDDTLASTGPSTDPETETGNHWQVVFDDRATTATTATNATNEEGDVFYRLTSGDVKLRFDYSTGMFGRSPLSSDAGRDDALAAIAGDAHRELRWLRELWKPLGVNVADFPDAAHEGWARFDALTADHARKWWSESQQIAEETQNPSLSEKMRKVAASSHAKSYRRLLMLRLRRPELVFDDSPHGDWVDAAAAS